MFNISDSSDLSHDDLVSLIVVLDFYRDFWRNSLSDFSHLPDYDPRFDEKRIAWINSIKTKLYIKLKEVHDNDAQSIYCFQQG